MDTSADKQEKDVKQKDASSQASSASGMAQAQGRPGENKGLDQELKEYKDKYLRLYAEFENTRKRYEREKAEFIKYAQEGLMVDFLNILDDLERTISVARAKHQDYASFLKGIEIVMTRIHELLKKNGITPIESVGKKFDPHSHEVLLQVEDAGAEDGMVVEELQKGYRLADRVVRTAKVKVSVHPPEP